MTICIPQGDLGLCQGRGYLKNTPVTKKAIMSKKAISKILQSKKGLQKRPVCKETGGGCCGEVAE